MFGAEWPGLHARLSKAVADSFRAPDRGMRNLTAAEMKRRIDFCLSKAAELRADLGWSTERIGDQVPAALKAFIDKVAWEPDERRSSWGDTEKTWTADN